MDFQFDEALAREVDDYAWRAEQAYRRNQPREAAELFARAAQLEERAAEALREGPIQVRSALAVSSVALWYKAGRWDELEQLALRWLAQADQLTSDACGQLRELLQRAWIEAQIDTDELAQTLPIELHLLGGEVRRGLAPAKLVRHRQTWLVGLLERVAEWKQGVRYRSSERVPERVEILQAPTLAPSFGIRLYVRSTNPDELSTEQLLRSCFELLEASAEEWEQALELRYRRGLLECVRELCADGDQIVEVRCSSPTWRVSLPEVRLDAEHRARLDRLLAQDEGWRAGPLSPSDEARREGPGRQPPWTVNDE
jgi:hypothetical protein